MTLKIYRTPRHVELETPTGRFVLPVDDWDALFCMKDLQGWLEGMATSDLNPVSTSSATRILAPVGQQEVWAAGVTWPRSRAARVAESEGAGGADFYDRVYDAERPELFLKATPHRVADPGVPMLLRSDASWIVPEPELTVAINRHGHIIGYTVGNDLSCRDIEAENPLYLPQAKTFDLCAGLGPCLLVRRDPLPDSTTIGMDVHRRDAVVFSGEVALGIMRRRPEELVPWLLRHNRFPFGCYLMTGTGIVPPDDFRLEDGDEVRIRITGIGELVNTVISAPARD